jgi:glutaredoxin
MHEITLYTKSGCCLCDDAKEQIRAARRRVDFAYREVDIESDPALFERHRFDVPVVEVDGRRAFKYRLSAEQLLARLESEGAHRKG